MHSHTLAVYHQGVQLCAEYIWTPTTVRPGSIAEKQKGGKEDIAIICWEAISTLRR